MKPLLATILVAVSGSNASIDATKYAVVMAKQYNCKVYAVYVVDTATIHMLALNKIFIPEESREYEESLTVNGERYLSFAEELASAKGVHLEKVIKKGAIHTEILSLAEEIKADAILLGGYEKERKSRDIIFQAHKQILYDAKCSILVVKEPEIEHIYKNL